MSIETSIIKRIQARHGARPDARLWRNETGVYWAGRFEGRDGDRVILRGASRVTAGLCTGSADLVGLRVVPVASLDPAGHVAVFMGLEVKSENTATEPHQRRWLALVRSMGGIAEVVQGNADVDRILGEP